MLALVAKLCSTATNCHTTAMMNLCILREGPLLLTSTYANIVNHTRPMPDVLGGSSLCDCLQGYDR